MDYTESAIKNGDGHTIIKVYNCSNCSEPLPESDPMCFVGANVYCGDCAYTQNKISERDYINIFCYHLVGVDGVCLLNGKPMPYVGKNPLRSRTDKQARKTKDYRKWRSLVIKRDGGMCTKCPTDTTLEAHHILSFKTHKSKRFDINNGVTLCKSCHIIEHTKGI